MLDEARSWLDLVRVEPRLERDVAVDVERREVARLPKQEAIPEGDRVPRGIGHPARPIGRSFEGSGRAGGLYVAAGCRGRGPHEERPEAKGVGRPARPRVARVVVGHRVHGGPFRNRKVHCGLLDLDHGVARGRRGAQSHVGHARQAQRRPQAERPPKRRSEPDLGDRGAGGRVARRRAERLGEVTDEDAVGRLAVEHGREGRRISGQAAPGLGHSERDVLEVKGAALRRALGFEVHRGLREEGAGGASREGEVALRERQVGAGRHRIVVGDERLIFPPWKVEGELADGAVEEAWIASRLGKIQDRAGRVKPHGVEMDERHGKSHVAHRAPARRFELHGRPLDLLARLADPSF